MLFTVFFRFVFSLNCLSLLDAFSLPSSSASSLMASAPAPGADTSVRVAALSSLFFRKTWTFLQRFEPLRLSWSFLFIILCIDSPLMTLALRSFLIFSMCF